MANYPFFYTLSHVLSKTRLSHITRTTLSLLLWALLSQTTRAQTPPSPNQQNPSPQRPSQEKPSKPKPQPQDQPPKEGKPLPQISPEARYDYQMEVTWIVQHSFRFHSPYEGASSFQARNETELSHSYELFLGARLVRNVEVYINPEIGWGNGLSGGVGLGGYSNGDLLGQPSLRPNPFLARYFVRWRVPMPHFGAHQGGEETAAEQVGRAPNIIAGPIPAHRLVITAGKFAVSDVFDINAYANNPRAQFMNKAFTNNLAYDFAQETRGYDLGASMVWVDPAFAVRLGTFAMPTDAGGADLAFNFAHDHSEQVELEMHPRLLRSKPPLILRLLAYRNVGNMGRYQNALAAQQTGLPPDLAEVRQRGAVKYGLGLNFEQALAQGGDTGVFGRLGWNDGATESFAFAECDRFVSLGGQLSGAYWKRKEDRLGVALAQSDLSAAHKQYLEAGGEGLALGDGKLRYGSERLVEIYYSYQLSKALALSLDYQYISNPGYNRDRGPASVVSVRAHLLF